MQTTLAGGEAEGASWRLSRFMAFLLSSNSIDFLDYPVHTPSGKA
jgi:hypothetical protein